MKHIKAPNAWENTTSALTVFLGGSIDMGSAGDWQQTVANKLEDFDAILLNPRRDDWDSSWKQSITDPQFNQQVTWELDNQDAADLIVYYFDPESKAPITLMELGLYANSKKVFVCCPEGYWRKGNIEMVCERFNIPLFPTLEELISRIKLRAVIRLK